MHCIGKSFRTWNFVLPLKELKRMQKHTIRYAQYFGTTFKFPNDPALITFFYCCNDFTGTKYLQWNESYYADVSQKLCEPINMKQAIVKLRYVTRPGEGLHTLIKISIVFPCPISRSLLVSHNIELWVFVEGVWPPHCLIIIKMVH